MRRTRDPTRDFSAEVHSGVVRGVAYSCGIHVRQRHLPCAPVRRGQRRRAQPGADFQNGLTRHRLGVPRYPSRKDQAAVPRYVWDASLLAALGLAHVPHAEGEWVRERADAEDGVRGFVHVAARGEGRAGGAVPGARLHRVGGGGRHLRDLVRHQPGEQVVAARGTERGDVFLVVCDERGDLLERPRELGGAVVARAVVGSQPIDDDCALIHHVVPLPPPPAASSGGVRSRHVRAD